MKKTILAFLFLPLIFACSESKFHIEGTSSVPGLEGKTLFLKVFDKDDMVTMDSAKVVHGRFVFEGKYDSVTMANVFLGDQSIMPLVVEQEGVKLTLEETVQGSSGTPLNDSLNAFIIRKTQIDAQIAELPHKESQLIMNGLDHEYILRELAEDAEVLQKENDELVTHFISANYNNVLGPGIFMILTSVLQYPILNPQIEQIVSLASPYFLENPYVKEYLSVARENMEKIQTSGEEKK